MGYGIGTFKVLHAMACEDRLPQLKRVIDLGAQEIHFSKGDCLSHPYRSIIGELSEQLGGSK